MPDAKHRWGGWSHDGERFAFTSNRRDESVFDVYVQNRDEQGTTPNSSTRATAGSRCPAGAPTTPRLLVSQAYSNFDRDLYVLDLEADEPDLTHLPPRGRRALPERELGPDGTGIYLVTDEGKPTRSTSRISTSRATRWNSRPLSTGTDGTSTASRWTTRPAGSSARETSRATLN